MDDELQKLNTDCVFFLASPLTCKKGMECEYRHSEIARLTPRDCWYWLAGNCLNPSCGFRHPPLEAHTGGSSGSNPPHQCSVAENNTGIPCYFYYSGFCSKGNKCTYLHSNWSAPSPSPAKPFKKGSAVKGTMLPEDEKLKQSVVMDDPTEKCRSSSQTYFKAEANVVPRCKKGLQKVPSNSGLKLSSSPEVAASEIEKATGDGFDPFSQSELVNCSSHVFKGQSLELHGQLYDHDAAEERWEPSPEFKASENGYSKYLPHEDDEGLLTFHPECSDHNSPLLYHELEEPDEYDPMHPDAGIMCKYEIYDSYSDVESAHGIDRVERVRDPLGRELPDFVLFHEKNLLPVELAAEDCDSVDLRDCLKRHREIDDHSSALLFRRHGSFHLNGFRGERLEGNGLSRRLHGRLREILRRHKKPTRSLRENGHFMNGVHKQGPLRHARTHSSRQHLRGKRMTYSRLHCTNPSKNSFMRVRQNAVGSSSFAGPKTLEQIKEEKGRKVEEKTECSGMYLRKNSFADFQGPKPLTELLKNKVS